MEEHVCYKRLPKTVEFVPYFCLFCKFAKMKSLALASPEIYSKIRFGQSNWDVRITKRIVSSFTYISLYVDDISFNSSTNAE